MRCQPEVDRKSEVLGLGARGVIVKVESERNQHSTAHTLTQPELSEKFSPFMIMSRMSTHKNPPDEI